MSREYGLRIAGEDRRAASGETFEVRNPAAARDQIRDAEPLTTLLKCFDDLLH